MTSLKKMKPRTFSVIQGKTAQDGASLATTSFTSVRNDAAFIAPSKSQGHLLSGTHPAGPSKATCFRAVGFDETALPILQAGLLRIAKECEVTSESSLPHGMKYIIDGSLSTPPGHVGSIRTIWIIDTGQDTPRFVTAYPQ